MNGSINLQEVKNGIKSVVEFITLDDEVYTDSWNGLDVYSVHEHGNSVSVTYVLPNDASAPAAMFALVGGSNLSMIRTHKVNNETNEVILTIKHVIDGVSDWTINSFAGMTADSSTITITYYTDSSVLLGEDFVSEVTTSEKRN